MHPSEPGDGHIIPSHENMVLVQLPVADGIPLRPSLFVPGIQLFHPLRRQNGLLVKGLKAGNDAELKLVFLLFSPDKGPGLLKLPVMLFHGHKKRRGHHGLHVPLLPGLHLSQKLMEYGDLAHRRKDLSRILQIAFPVRKPVLHHVSDSVGGSG